MGIVCDILIGLVACYILASIIWYCVYLLTHNDNRPWNWNVLWNGLMAPVWFSVWLHDLWGIYF